MLGIYLVGCSIFLTNFSVVLTFSIDLQEKRVIIQKKLYLYFEGSRIAIFDSSRKRKIF